MRSQPLEFQQDNRHEPFNPSNDKLERAQSISTFPEGAIAPGTGQFAQTRRRGRPRSRGVLIWVEKVAKGARNWTWPKLN